MRKWFWSWLRKEPLRLISVVIRVRLSYVTCWQQNYSRSFLFCRYWVLQGGNSSHCFSMWLRWWHKSKLTGEYHIPQLKICPIPKIVIPDNLCCERETRRSQANRIGKNHQCRVWEILRFSGFESLCCSHPHIVGFQEIVIGDLDI